MNRKRISDAHHDVTCNRLKALQDLLAGQPVLLGSVMDHLIDDMMRLRLEMAAEGDRQGLTSACEGTLSLCRGECCRYHYPSPLSLPDLLVILVASPREILERVREAARLPYPHERCLFLDPDGCVFPVKTRPLPCVAAYPCHTTAEYRDYLAEMDGRRTALQQSAIRLLTASGLSL